jgi:hypothetical protein
MELQRSNLAELLGITPTLVTKLSSSGVFKYGSKKGLYDVKSCIQSYIEYATEEILSKQNVPENQNIKESLDYWKMQRQRISALKEMGNLISIVDAEKIMTFRLIQIRDILTTIEATWAPYLIALDDLPTTQKIIGQLLDNVFVQISNLSEEEIQISSPTVEDAEEDENI